jgi:hypothetical protein
MRFSGNISQNILRESKMYNKQKNNTEKTMRRGSEVSSLKAATFRKPKNQNLGIPKFNIHSCYLNILFVSFSIFLINACKHTLVENGTQMYIKFLCEIIRSQV